MISKKMKFVAACAALSCGAVGTVYAGAKGYAHSQVALTVFNVTAGRIADAADFTTITPSNTSGASGDLASVGVGPTATSNLAGVDTVLACEGPGCGAIAENTFSQILPLGTHFSRGDTGPGPASGGSIITGLPGATVPAQVSVLAETQLNVSDTGASSANGNNNTGFSFTMQGAQEFRFDVVATTETESLLHPNTTGNASGSGTWSITVTNDDTGVVIFSWSPDGGLNAGDATGGTEIADTIDLTFGSAINIPGTTGLLVNAGSAMASTGVLAANVNYSLAITQTAQTAATAVKNQVPEPSTIALLGMGLLGLGAARGRKRT